MFYAHRLEPLVIGLLFFFFNDTATTEIYTLSLHDALRSADARLARALAIGERREPSATYWFEAPRHRSTSRRCSSSGTTAGAFRPPPTASSTSTAARARWCEDLSGAIEWRRAVESTVIVLATVELAAVSLAPRFRLVRVLSYFLKRSNTALNSLINVAGYAA